MTDLTTPHADADADVPRDRWNRPLIIPPDGGTPVPYQRASSWGKKLEDNFGLEKWKLRNAAVGLAQRPELVTSILAQPGNDSHVNRVVDQAIEAARGSSAATYGSAIHQLTEQVDAGHDLPDGLDDITRRTLTAYRKALEGFTIVATERFVVCDEVQVAGTFDRILKTPGGATVVADVKTGNTNKRTGRLAYTHAVAVQMACYARGSYYNPTTGGRTDTEIDVVTSGLIIHLPSGEGVAQLHWIDLAAGWEAAQLATQVHEWRGRKKLTVPYTDKPIYG